jgi:hypothetical protein
MELEPVDYSMQKFFFNEESEAKLKDVNPQLAEVMRKALAISDIEFQILEGKRTTKEHTKYYEKGITQRSDQSAHLYGYAVDLIIYLDGRPVLEYEPYDDVFDCVKMAAQELGVKIRWGGAPNWHDITTYVGFVEDLANSYVDLRREAGKRPLPDVHHFELALD